MNLINLTRETIALQDRDGRVVEIPPDPRYVGSVSIGDHLYVEDEEGRAFPLNVQVVAEVKGMPEPREGTFYIVPVELAMALQDTRDDVAFAAEHTAPPHEPDGRPVATLLRRVVPYRKTASPEPLTTK
jgi:hypothetical protein